MIALFLGLSTILFWLNAIFCLALSMATPYDEDRFKYSLVGLCSVMFAIALIMRGTLS